MKYLLEGKKVIREPDLIKWANWFETANRHVAKDEIDGVSISTVFLGLDHGFGDGPPILFETMVFGGELDQEQERYATFEQAEKGHKLMVERIKHP